MSRNFFRAEGGMGGRGKGGEGRERGDDVFTGGSTMSYPPPPSSSCPRPLGLFGGEGFPPSPPFLFFWDFLFFLLRLLVSSCFFIPFRLFVKGGEGEREKEDEREKREGEKKKKEEEKRQRSKLSSKLCSSDGPLEPICAANVEKMRNTSSVAMTCVRIFAIRMANLDRTACGIGL